MTGVRQAAHADKRPFLAGRQAILRATRTWFEAEGFAEVECGALV
jgi:elongation factor P--beta-lysine ligase